MRLLFLLLLCGCNAGIEVGSCVMYDNLPWRIIATRGSTLVYMSSVQGRIALEASLVRELESTTCEGVTND